MRIIYKSLFLALFVALAAQLGLGQEKPKTRLFDTFTYQGGDEAQMRLEQFFNELTQNKNSFGYVIVYGGKIGKKGVVRAHIGGIQEYFTYIRKGAVKNYVIINGGFRENQEIDLWIVPEDTCPPLPTPTVDFEKVRFKGTAPKIYHYWCC